MIKGQIKTLCLRKVELTLPLMLSADEYDDVFSQIYEHVTGSRHKSVVPIGVLMMDAVDKYVNFLSHF